MTFSLRNYKIQLRRLFLSIIILLVVLLNAFATEIEHADYKIPISSSSFSIKRESITLGKNKFYITYSDIPTGKVGLNLVIILDKNKLASLEIKKLSQYLAAAGMITSTIYIVDDITPQKLQQLISTQIKAITKYFTKKSYKITSIAVIGDNLRVDKIDYFTVNYYPDNISYDTKYPTLIFTSNECNVPWKLLEKVTCVNMKNISLDHVHSQIKFWLQIHMLPCPIGTIKTADHMFGQVFCIPSPQYAVKNVLFPFNPMHGVRCIQGSISKFPYSHFFHGTIYALDFATPDTERPGEIYAAFDGVAYVHNKCKLNKDGTAPLSHCGYGLGNYVYLLRNDGIFASYAHLSKIYVNNTQYVRRGQLIGLEGNTGLAGTRHLHFSLHRLTQKNPKMFSVDSKDFISLPFRLKINGIDNSNTEILSLDLKCSDDRIIYGVWE